MKSEVIAKTFQLYCALQYINHILMLLCIYNRIAGHFAPLHTAVFGFFLHWAFFWFCVFKMFEIDLVSYLFLGRSVLQEEKTN